MSFKALLKIFGFADVFFIGILYGLDKIDIVHRITYLSFGTAHLRSTDNGVSPPQGPELRRAAFAFRKSNFYFLLKISSLKKLAPPAVALAKAGVP